MASGDGLILRVKPHGGALSLAQARGIAEVSRRWGNGALDLTSRANLQIRGLSEATLDEALGALGAVRLLDRDAAAEAVRNVVSSPLAGLDPDVTFDIRPAVAALEGRLAQEASLQDLPPKFGFVVDDGGSLGLDDVPADIRFEALLSQGGAAAFAITLGTASEPRGMCEVDGLAEAATALAHQVIAAHLEHPEILHMRHLVRRDGAAAVFARAGLLTLASFRETRRRTGNKFGLLLDGDGYVGVAAAFGRLEAAQLEVLVSAAAEAGVAELRLTPWRALLALGSSREARQNLRRTCAAVGLIVDADESRLAVAACPGTPGCHRGSTPVLGHAGRLAARLGPSMLQRGITLHVSGCGKGCAHAGQAAFTMVGHDGLYDIVIAGRAADAPSMRSLSFDEAEAWLGKAMVGERP